MPKPLMLSTWSFGQIANRGGWSALTEKQCNALDAVEQGCISVEQSDCLTVGNGSYPDRSGELSLDASIMVSPCECGSVCYVRQCDKPATLARLVMETTPHVMLAGDGADQFALKHGLTGELVMSEQARKIYGKWQEKYGDTPDHPDSFNPVRNIEEKKAAEVGEDLPHNKYHDTVGVLAMNEAGKMAGACSTSGWAFKLPGRVGDSPIIGHGLYVDPKVGGAVATGSGELAMGICASFLAVENMRRGMTPLEAITQVLQRVIEVNDIKLNQQLGMIIMREDGRFSTASLRAGFQTAVKTENHDKLIKPHRILLEE